MTFKTSLIRRCLHCQRFYWRYRRDHPPRFFCSIPCQEMRGQAKALVLPRTPRALLAEIHHHRRLFHGTDSILPAFEDCERCEELQGLYSESLGWYLEHPEEPLEPERTPAALKGQRKRARQIELIESGRWAV